MNWGRLNPASPDPDQLNGKIGSGPRSDRPSSKKADGLARFTYGLLARITHSEGRKSFLGKPLEQKEADHGTLFDGSPGACCGGDR